MTNDAKRSEANDAPQAQPDANEVSNDVPAGHNDANEVSNDVPAGHNDANEASKAPVAIVVNDDATQRKVLASLLARGGLDVRDFETAETALDAPSAGLSPDLIVTDLYMPGIDGWRFCRLLRSPDYEPFNDTPVLVVSATFSGEEPAQITADLGANAFLPQPVDSRRLLETVNALLRNEAPVRRARVLIVEDDKDLAELLRITFEKHGYHADIALTGGEALKILDHRCNIAIFDYHLPDMHGDKLLQESRRRCPGCAVVMITGDTDPELAVAWMKAGAAACAHKPFDPEYLIELCARASRERALLRTEEMLEERTRSLRESEAFNAALFDYNPIQTIVVDREGRILRWNKVKAQSGERLPAVGDRMYVDYAGFQQTDMRAALLQCIESGEAVDFPEQTYADRVLSIKIAPFPAGNPHAAVITSRDITEHRRAEEALRRSERPVRLRAFPRRDHAGSSGPAPLRPASTKVSSGLPVCGRWFRNASRRGRPAAYGTPVTGATAFR